MRALELKLRLACDMGTSPLLPPIGEAKSNSAERRATGQPNGESKVQSYPGKQLLLTSLLSSSRESRTRGSTVDELPRSHRRHCTAPSSVTSASSLTARTSHRDRPHVAPCSKFWRYPVERSLGSLSPRCAWRRTLVRGPIAHPRNLPHPFTAPN